MCYVKNLSIFAVAEKNPKASAYTRKPLLVLFFFVLVSETYD